MPSAKFLPALSNQNSKRESPLMLRWERRQAAVENGQRSLRSKQPPGPPPRSPLASFESPLSRDSPANWDFVFS